MGLDDEPAGDTKPDEPEAKGIIFLPNTLDRLDRFLGELGYSATPEVEAVERLILDHKKNPEHVYPLMAQLPALIEQGVRVPPKPRYALEGALHETVLNLFRARVLLKIGWIDDFLDELWDTIENLQGIPKAPSDLIGELRAIANQYN
jgi:hypothetical protein